VPVLLRLLVPTSKATEKALTSLRREILPSASVASFDELRTSTSVRAQAGFLFTGLQPVFKSWPGNLRERRSEHGRKKNAVFGLILISRGLVRFSVGARVSILPSYLSLVFSAPGLSSNFFS